MIVTVITLIVREELIDGEGAHHEEGHIDVGAHVEKVGVVLSNHLELADHLHTHDVMDKQQKLLLHLCNLVGVVV